MSLLEALRNGFMSKAGLTEEEMADIDTELDKTRDQLDDAGVARKTTDEPAADEKPVGEEASPTGETDTDNPEVTEPPNDDDDEELDSDEAAKMLDALVNKRVDALLTPIVQTLMAAQNDREQAVEAKLTDLTEQVARLNKANEDRMAELTNSMPKGLMGLLSSAATNPATEMSAEEVEKMGNPQVPTPDTNHLGIDQLLKA